MTSRESLHWSLTDQMLPLLPHKRSNSRQSLSLWVKHGNWINNFPEHPKQLLLCLLPHLARMTLTNISLDLFFLLRILLSSEENSISLSDTMLENLSVSAQSTFYTSLSLNAAYKPRLIWVLRWGGEGWHAWERKEVFSPDNSIYQSEQVHLYKDAQIH